MKNGGLMNLKQKVINCLKTQIYKSKRDDIGKQINQNHFFYSIKISYSKIRNLLIDFNYYLIINK